MRRFAMNAGGTLLVPDESPLLELVPSDGLALLADRWARARAYWGRLFGPMFAGFRPDEGDLLTLNVMLKRSLGDRDADLELGLFTNSSPAQSITESAITEPTGTGYGRKTLTDATWVSANPATYAQQTFTAGSGGWSGSVQGYFIATKASGGTQRLIAIEVDANGPYTFAENDTYDIDLSITAA